MIDTLSEEVVREVFKYMNCCQVENFCAVSREFLKFGRAFLKTRITTGQKLMLAELKILKTTLNRNKMKRTKFERFLYEAFGLLDNSMDILAHAYQQYMGRSVFPVVPAKVRTCFQIDLLIKAGNMIMLLFYLQCLDEIFDMLPKFKSHRKNEPSEEVKREFKNKLRELNGEVEEKVGFFHDNFAGQYKDELRSILRMEKEKVRTWKQEVTELKSEVTHIIYLLTITYIMCICRVVDSPILQNDKLKARVFELENQAIKVSKLEERLNELEKKK
jgi:hypothetical protein